ncbi:MAG: 50S ribosome-binding GTPase [Bacilli bacterium]|nr:50S ribosome-binding GTPase [Bacilli bacterium]
MNKCICCGNISKNTICDRCFKIKHYSDYTKVEISDIEFDKLINDVNNTDDLVILVVDLLNLNPNLSILSKIKNDVLLVLTKRDLLPSSIFEDKLLNYLDNSLNIIDRIIISSEKNYQFDLLYELINKYKKSNNVYVMGYTNAGKSTMINKILKDYSDNDLELTTSCLPNTTLNKLEIKVSDELTLIDTPGIVDKGNICYYLNYNELKKIIPKNKIKPRTYQISKMQYIVIDDILKLDIKNNNITFFISNNLNIKRLYKDINTNLVRHDIHVSNNEDIVIEGLGFIKFTKEEDIVIYTIKDVLVYKRKSLI